MKENMVCLNKLFEFKIDDDDELDLSELDDSPVVLLHDKIKPVSALTKFVNMRIVADNKTPLEEWEKHLIKSINENQTSFLHEIEVTDKNQLYIYMRRAISYFGNDGNFNWIDTSKCKSFIKLFENYSDFNGDITLWNTDSLENLIGTFTGCKSFTRDISGWNFSNVIWVNRSSFIMASPQLKELSNKLHKDGVFAKSKLPW